MSTSYSVKVQKLNKGITQGDIRELIMLAGPQENIVKIERISDEEARVIFDRSDLSEACEVLTGVPIGKGEYTSQVTIEREFQEECEIIPNDIKPAES